MTELCSYPALLMSGIWVDESGKLMPYMVLTGCKKMSRAGWIIDSREFLSLGDREMMGSGGDYGGLVSARPSLSCSSRHISQPTFSHMPIFMWSYTKTFFKNSTFYFEIIIGSHEVVRNNTEIPSIFLTIFFPTPVVNILQYYNPDSNIAS